jgi:uncharacterized protein (TIGR03503 family)
LEIIKSLVFCFLFVIHINYAFSQEIIENIKEEEQTTEQIRKTLQYNTKQSMEGEISFYQSDNVTNGIPYFDNRFRIDAELDEITLIFFRTAGSRPIILVQPDGKKIRANDYNPEKVKWYDDRTFDMINIIKPMPGPWQAVGNILPESKILIVSEIKIEIEPLPEVLLAGETLKVEGKLYNGQQNIDVPGFKEVVHLDVNFFSTNNPLYENFGADALKLTSFKDNGHDLDEYAGDNIYTGEFILDFPAGEWQPVFVITLPLVERELRQKPVLVNKLPVTTSVTISKNENTPHKLVLTIDPTNVDPKSLIFQGKITFPDNQIKPFSIIEYEDIASRTKDIPYTEPGIYHVNLSAFGRTITGREFRLVIPAFSFNVKADINGASIDTGEEADSMAVSSTNETTLSVTEQQRKHTEEQAAKLAEEIIQQKMIDEEKSTQTIILIAGGNTIVILLAIILFLFMRKKSNKK